MFIQLINMATVYFYLRFVWYIPVVFFPTPEVTLFLLFTFVLFMFDYLFLHFYLFFTFNPLDSPWSTLIFYFLFILEEKRKIAYHKNYLEQSFCYNDVVSKLNIYFIDIKDGFFCLYMIFKN